MTAGFRADCNSYRCAALIYQHYWAVKNGAGKIIPATDAGEAATILSKLDSPDVVLAGEIGGVKHPDFHIGNSPSEFSPEVVANKTIVISTSNGTKVINGAKGAKSVLIGGMINMSAVAKRVAKSNDDVLIICAGTDDEISADDLARRRYYRRYT